MYMDFGNDIVLLLGQEITNPQVVPHLSRGLLFLVNGEC